MRAELPDFFELARGVIAALEGNIDSPTKKLIDVAREVESRLNIGGLISADRVFAGQVSLHPRRVAGLFEPECNTPRQIELANAFCRYLEMAKTHPHGASGQ